ncbi:MAG TPA: tRNA-dihydrouridine synthase family protein, partial [Candidatus Woesebacteria bacterium]|nr:tRNA-dihydrouridine synthase family protein [Candidatus Woesebacteria bacterium]
MYKGFWDNLERPIIAMSPMDGVTDAAYRYITDTYGKPAILFTEFTSVEGIAHGATRLLSPFVHHKSKTPIVAQIYGSTPQAFYDTTFVICEMDFDGVDINMGCPDHNIAKKGCGAGLIRTPQLAYNIIKSVKQAVQDWSDGKKIEDTNLKPVIIDWVH